MPDALAATASRFLDDACEELGLADGVHEWLRASERVQTMAWIADAWAGNGPFEPAVVTGKPLELGGSHEREAATGRGVVISTLHAARREGIDLAEGGRVAIQGTGNVGLWAARLFAQQGLRVVAMAKSDGAVHAPDGLDLDALAQQLSEEGSLDGLEDADQLDPDDLVGVDCDVLVPAARAGMLDGGGADRVRARIVTEGANGPLTPEADAALRQRGVLVLPDVLANVGGVVVSAFEWLQDRRHERWDEPTSTTACASASRPPPTPPSITPTRTTPPPAAPPTPSRWSGSSARRGRGGCYRGSRAPVGAVRRGGRPGERHR